MTTDIPERFYEQARSIRNGVIWESNAATRVLAEALYGAWKEGAAEAEAENERLRKALEPFAEIAGEPWADENGWTNAACQNDRICDWFGPSAFRTARRALEGEK